MTRLQLLSSGMLRRREGHLSSFNPAAGDLTQYLFLNLVKEVVCGDQIQDILSLNVLDNAPDKFPVVSKTPPIRKITDKQKQALKQLQGFLSTKPTIDAAQSRKRSNDDPDEPDDDGEVDEISCPPAEESTANTKKKGKRGTAASSKKKGGAAKVGLLTKIMFILLPSLINSTIVAEKKDSHRRRK